MTDFLTRLAGRALRQMPVLEPLMPSWATPIDPADDSVDIDSPVQDVATAAPAVIQRSTTQHEASPPRNRPAMRAVASVDLPARVAVDVAAAEDAAHVVPEAVTATGPAMAMRHAEAPPPPARQRQPAVPAAVETRHQPAAKAEAVPNSTAGAQRMLRRTRGTGQVTLQTMRPAADVVQSGQVARPAAGSTSVPSAQRGPLSAAADALATAWHDSTPRVHDAAPQVSIAPVSHHDEPMRAPPAARRTRAEPEAPHQPTINVSIGRIVVRAAPPAPRTPLPTAAPPNDPRVSLDQYLAERSGSRR